MSTTTNHPETGSATSSPTSTQASSIEPSSSAPVSTTPAPPAEPETIPEAPETTEIPETAEDDSRAGREAQRYRQQLRTAEAKLDALAQVVIGAKLDGLNLSARTLTATGTNLADLFDTEGNFDDVALLATLEGTHEAIGVPPGERLGSIVAEYRRTGNVNWTAGRPGGYVRSAGTGDELRGMSTDFGEAMRRARDGESTSSQEMGENWRALIQDARRNKP